MCKILRREHQEGLRFHFGEKEKNLLEFLEKNGKIDLIGFQNLANISQKVASHTLVLLVLGKILRIIPQELKDEYCLF